MSAPKPHSDTDIRSIIERTMRRVATGMISADQGANDALAAIARAQTTTTKAQRLAQVSAQLLAEYDALGADRKAAGIVARRRSRDPLERASIERRIRRAAARRKTDQVRLQG